MTPGAVTRSAVERIARIALGARDATLVDHQAIPLDYDAYLPGRSVTRVAGRAIVDGAERPWSAVLKWTDPPGKTPTAPVERGRREALAYGSGLLDGAGGLRVPRAFDIDLGDDGSTSLWLEDVPDESSEPWPIETYAIAARALGRFNGAFLSRPLPTDDWLVLDWAERQSEPVDMAATLADIAARAADERARRALGADVGARAIRMQEDQDTFIETLARLPQTLCHHDAARSNLVARAGADGASGIVAIDWESTGPGSLGAEIATLVSGSLRKGDVPAGAATELDTTVFAGYLAGLRDAGWMGDAGVVRLGYTMSLALRCWFVRGTLHALTEPAGRPLLGRAPDVPAHEVRAAFALVSRFLLDRTDEARSLAATRIHER